MHRAIWKNLKTGLNCLLRLVVNPRETWLTSHWRPKKSGVTCDPKDILAHYGQNSVSQMSQCFSFSGNSSPRPPPGALPWTPLWDFQVPSPNPYLRPPVKFLKSSTNYHPLNLKCQISPHRCKVLALQGKNSKVALWELKYRHFAMLLVINKLFWRPWRWVKSEPNQTWHGVRGPWARSCTSKTFGDWCSFATTGAENSGETHPLNLKLPVTPRPNPSKFKQRINFANFVKIVPGIYPCGRSYSTIW